MATRHIVVSKMHKVVLSFGLERLLKRLDVAGPVPPGENMKQSTKDQIKGKLHEVKGNVKEQAGKVQTKVGQIEMVFEK